VALNLKWQTSGKFPLKLRNESEADFPFALTAEVRCKSTLIDQDVRLTKLLSNTSIEKDRSGGQKACKKRTLSWLAVDATQVEAKN
jgi:hypothetical protein